MKLRPLTPTLSRRVWSRDESAPGMAVPPVPTMPGDAVLSIPHHAHGDSL